MKADRKIIQRRLAKIRKRDRLIGRRFLRFNLFALQTLPLGLPPRNVATSVETEAGLAALLQRLETCMGENTDADEVR